MTRPKLAKLRDPAGRYKPGMSGNPAGRKTQPGQLPLLTIETKAKIMAAANRQVRSVAEDSKGTTVSIFEGCVEVLGSVREGDRKAAAGYVRMVQLAAASVPPLERFPEPLPRENIEAIITVGTEEEFEAMLASQQVFLKRLVAEYSDGQLATAMNRLARSNGRRMTR